MQEFLESLEELREGLSSKGVISKMIRDTSSVSYLNKGGVVYEVV